MRPVARVLVDESHRQAWSTRIEVAEAMNPTNPADASYAEAAASARRAGLAVDVHADGPLTDEVLIGVDALVIPHCADDSWEHTTGVGLPALDTAELAAVDRFVRAGGGLVILGETEQPKYGNNLADLAASFGITIANATVQDPRHAFKDVATWVLGDLSRGPVHDLTARVNAAAFYRAGVLAPADGTAPTALSVVASTSPEADPAGSPLVMTSTLGGGRVVVTADSDLFGDDSIGDLDHRQLWLNIVTWAAGSPAAASTAGVAHTRTWADDDPGWIALATACEALKAMQAPLGSINLGAHQANEAAAQVDALIAAVQALAPRFPHQHDYFTALEADLRRWVATGFGVPDFLDSLQQFHPDALRVNGTEHLAVFPMYTQNGNPNRNFEAVITRTFWPDWLTDQERTYENKAFVPIEFVAFTSGYDTNSAVFFPETVAVRETPAFTWGGIFCDREAARFRVVSRAAATALGLSLPPDADLLLNDQQLAQETFVLWDLIHDRIHSLGDLPFDPFMIKQRMPYWMYSLEELRCDVTTYRESLGLDADGGHLGRFIRYAIVFDRIFRFSITGGRARNYDGLGGQIMFAWLHRDSVLRWTNNQLTVDWDRIDESMVRLCDAVESLYRSGIDRPRIGQWLAVHAFVSDLVPPHPASVWAKGADALPLAGEPRDLIDVALPDEFPLNVFFESLAKKIGAVIESTRGITA